MVENICMTFVDAAKIFNINEDLLKELFIKKIWVATRENNNLTKKLKRKKLIVKSKRGSWILNEKFVG